MNRDLLSAVQAKFAELVTVGTSAIAASPGATGVVSFDPGNQLLGSFQVVLQVTTPGAPGAAQVMLSLDGGNNFIGPVLVPAPVAPSVVGRLELPLPSPTAGNLSLVLSGLVLNFSGNFTVGDSYSFTANGAVTFLYGEDEKPSQDSLYPRVIWIPREDDFEGTEGWTVAPYDSSKQPRSLVTAAARFEARCWGIDYDRTEVLRDQVINSLHLALTANQRLQGGEWEPASINQAGRVYVLRWRCRHPIVDISNQWVISTPPHTAELTATVINSQ
jgi:hypothetical protein